MTKQLESHQLLMDMFYFEINFVVWEGCIITFNKCLLSMQSIMVGTGHTVTIKLYPQLLRNCAHLERQDIFKIFKILIIYKVFIKEKHSRQHLVEI